MEGYEEKPGQWDGEKRIKIVSSGNIFVLAVDKLTKICAEAVSWDLILTL